MLSRHLNWITCSAIVVMLASSTINAQETNFDEDKVPIYELPDPLVFNDGSTVTSQQDWSKRRVEILQLFKDHVYGTLPEEKTCEAGVIRDVVFKLPGDSITSTKRIEVKLREVELRFGQDGTGPIAHLLIIMPHATPTLNEELPPCPIVLGYNFGGNHTIHPTTEITIHPVWNREQKSHVPADSTRGEKSSRWPIHAILSRGFGVATIYYGDIAPDFDDGFANGVHRIYPQLQNRFDNWSSIGAWAWGLHRVMDYFESDSAIDHRKVVLFGHSRLGKTALWAGATDERFAVVISNNSGCGGAALARRRFGETVERINTTFPHWFCQRYKDYNDCEEKLPVDQHMLISLMAPRPVYVASAVEDRWADPKGEFLSAFQAQPVYDLFGLAGLGIEIPDMPAVDKPIGETIGYHLRTGKHDVTEFDWIQYLNFVQRHFNKK